MSEDIWNSLSYSMQEKTKKIIELKENYNNFRIFDFNMFVITILLIISTFFMIYRFYTNPYLINNYIFPLALFVGCSGYLYIRYNNRELAKKILKDEFNSLRINMIENIDNQFQFEFCDHNTKCKCKENYIKYLKNEYGIDLVFK